MLLGLHMNYFLLIIIMLQIIVILLLTGVFKQYALLFINLKGQNDAYQKLSYTSNKIDVAVSHTLAGVNNGVPYSKSSGQYVYTDYATIYNNVNEAIACYRLTYMVLLLLVNTYFIMKTKRAQLLNRS